MPSAAMLSMKHAASRPSPPLPSAGIGFRFAHLLEIDAQVPQRLLHRLDHGEVAERVEQQAADQVLDRKVIDALAARRGFRVPERSSGR